MKWLILCITLMYLNMDKTIYQYSMKDLSGQEISLSKYKGKVVLIVNTASECGLTPQLGDLEKLYQKYKDKGFVILGFPSNEFLFQEPLAGAAIQTFCSSKYGVTFPLFEKTHVKGSDKCPLYQYLSDKKLNGKVDQEPTWNFHKYLIDKNGHVIVDFSPKTEPLDKSITKALEELL